MNRIQRLLTLLLLVCGMITGLWASSTSGALTGRFTINASGEKVLFSQGNLQYQASTNTWRFATNQYDYIGSANANISDSYTGWIDLFGWATNGLEANTATGKMPYYTGTTNEDYGPSITSGEFDRTVYDWGKAIDDSWHTLSNAEWNYIFAGRANYSSLYGFGRLFGVNGVFLLPDDWSWSETEIATAATAAGFTWSGGAKTFTSNIISDNALWSAMQSAGAVFIPTAGYRQGTTINMSGNGGDYWSSTASSATNAYRISFYDKHLNLSNNYGRSDGISVRLVRSSLEKDAEGNYLLSSADDWKDFAAIVNNGTNTAAKARMTADIDLGDDQTTIGSGNTNAENANVVFQGVFDGNGHTLTINYNTSEGFYAPIRHISGATIKNLHVTGSIVSSGGRVGGIVCGVFGGSSIQSKIEKCRSSVILTSNCQVPVSDAESVGGIVGQVGFRSNLSLEDCIFDGEITGHVSNVIWSGLVGVLDGNVNTTRCLQAGSFNDLNNGTTANSATIVCRWQNAATSIVTMDATYYIHSFKTVQGTQATTAELADGTTTTALNAGREETVWVQDPLTNQPMLKIFANKNLILGDANDSGEVEIGDITSVLTLMATPDASGYNNKAADANQSGAIEIGDITTILTIMAGGE